MSETDKIRNLPAIKLGICICEIFKLKIFLKNLHLRSFEILTTIIFVSSTIMGENTISILNCYFSKYIYTLANQTYFLHIENKSNCYNQYSFGLIFSWNPKKCHTNQVHHKFLLCPKRNNSQTFKSSNYKKFYLVCILWLQLASINVFCSMR